MPLTQSQMTLAVQWNPVYGRLEGWERRYAEVLKFLGYPSTCPTAELFAQAVADWQAKRPPLIPDGILGAGSWSKMEPELRKPPGAAPAAPEPLPGGPGPLWYQYAQAEANRWATMIASWGAAREANSAEEYLDWDERYFRASPYFGKHSHPDGTLPSSANPDWCAAFVNWCLHRAGFSHTGSARAGSFLNRDLWRFDALKTPQPGCVVVFNNGSHVTFFSQWWGTAPRDPGGDVTVPSGQGISVLGGNQSNRVRMKSYTDLKLTAKKGRNGVTSPYLWPLRGEATCAIHSVPTACGHYCGINPV